MANSNVPGVRRPEVSRRTLRLTIRSSERGFELRSVERLTMITPPQPGERPQIGKHSGYWMELRDDKGQVLAHRLLGPAVFNSVEIHSPGGKIERKFGKIRSAVIVVLLPDIAAAQEAVLVGNPPEHPRTELSRELARFSVPSAPQGGQ